MRQAFRLGHRNRQRTTIINLNCLAQRQRFIQTLRRMIDQHHKRAEQTGARVVHTCGFDSIPSDLGTWFTQQRAIERFGEPCVEVRMSVKGAKGGVSGGTAASGYAVEDEEWAIFLSEGGTVDKGVGLAARSLLADAARRVRAFSLPGITYDDSARVQAIKDAIAMYGAHLPRISVRMPGPIASDSGFENPIASSTYSTGT